MEENDLKLFEKIKNNSKPDIKDLWSLSEARFIEWRKIHDFPVLLKHFDKTLPDFIKWKNEQKITNDTILETGFITPFLEKKKLSVNKTLYLTNQSYDNRQNNIVLYIKEEGEKEYLGTAIKLKFIQSFISYLDWCDQKKRDPK